MYSGYTPHAPGAFPVLILLAALYVSKVMGDECRCPHLEWLLQLLLQEHLEGHVVGGLEGCKNALSTTTLQTPGRTADFLLHLFLDSLSPF